MAMLLNAADFRQSALSGGQPYSVVYMDALAFEQKQLLLSVSGNADLHLYDAGRNANVLSVRRSQQTIVPTETGRKTCHENVAFLRMPRLRLYYAKGLNGAQSKLTIIAETLGKYCVAGLED
ncbi:hypothetical protein AVEN_88645-1 [Araneus ventricosus]|uniref:Uncharacterized protein n=1 Tax=Araneus ventricosus TaxID=182803 RepID=A0A4Y2PD82_ARAVE|nr:hypothetical protein AVEN_88645-1 [Araneus ventricosus]